MMKTRNSDLREAIYKAGLRQWQVAEKYGIHEGNFSRLLRKEQDVASRSRILNIIRDLEQADNAESR